VGNGVKDQSIRLGQVSLLALAALAACGGAPEARPPIREEAVPTITTLAAPGGPGAALLRAGDLSGARVALEAELSGDPDRLAPLNDLAVSYYLEGHLDAARRLLDEVVASGRPREQQSALVNLGELYAIEGHREAAQAYLESARSLDPGRAEPLYALALLADGRGDLAAARALARRALELDDGTARAAFAFAFGEERRHLEALVAEAGGDRVSAGARWRELAAGRFPTLAASAARHLGEP
jgi:Flp pilus assembly protein TadD